VLTSLSSESVRPGDPSLVHAVRVLRRRTGADIALFARDGRTLANTDPEPNEVFAAGAAATRTGRPQRLVTGQGAEAEAEAARPLSIDDRSVVVAARKPLVEVQGAVGVVQRAFTIAAAAGLASALLVGLILAARLTGRLRHLRDSALRVAEIGPIAEFKPARGHDEIADLGHAFATMQERLREQEQARRAFVATASHELRTPLASLRVILDLLIADLDAEPVAVESAREQARNADEQSERLSRLAADLLDVSRIDAGVPIRTELVDLATVLRSVAAELEVRLEDEGRTLELEATDDAGRWAVGDPGSVAQIARILLDNALRHTSGPAGVRVRVGLAGGLAALTVEDDGPGVAPDDRERVFERFTRGAHAREGGFGLGLAIARELARRMGGDLRLAGGPPGARFVLTLPAAPAP
jgi:signal transduction histidine kinase